jgi:hypothetical protein
MSIYYLIDKNRPLSAVFKSDDMYLVIHELLSMVNAEIDVLNKYNITNKTVQVDNLSVLECKKYKSKHFPVIIETYSFRYTDHCHVYKNSDDEIVNLDDTICCDLVRLIDQKLCSDAVSKIGNSCFWSSDESNYGFIDKKSVDAETLQKEITDLSGELQKKTDECMNDVCIMNYKRNDLKVQEEKQRERARVFEVDKKTYFRMLEQKVPENAIPELFADKYPIFKFMDEQGLLNNEDACDNFIEFYDDCYPKVPVEKDYVPHDINYKN